MANFRKGVCSHIQITVNNLGGDPATSVIVDIPAIASGDFIFNSLVTTSDPSLVYNGGTQQFEMPTLAASASVVFTISVTPTVEGAQSININTSSANTDPNPINNTDTLNETILSDRLAPGEIRDGWIRSGAVLLVDAGMAHPDGVANPTNATASGTFTPLVGDDCSYDTLQGKGGFNSSTEDTEFGFVSYTGVSTSTSTTGFCKTHTANNFTRIFGQNQGVLMFRMKVITGVGSSDKHAFFAVNTNNVECSLCKLGSAHPTHPNEWYFQLGTKQGIVFTEQDDGTGNMTVSFALTATGIKVIVNGVEMVGDDAGVNPPTTTNYIGHNGSFTAVSGGNPHLTSVQWIAEMGAFPGLGDAMVLGKELSTATGLIVSSQAYIVIPVLAFIPGDYSVADLINLNNGQQI